MANFKRLPFKQPLLDPSDFAALRNIPIAKPDTLCPAWKNLGSSEKKAERLVSRPNRGRLRLIFASAR